MLSFRFWTRSVFDLGRPMMPKMHSRIVTTITTVRHFKFCVMEWKCLLIRDCYDCAFLISPETRLATEPRVIWIFNTITTVRHFKFCVMEWKCLLIRDCYDCAFLISPETRLATEPRVIWIFTLDRKS